MSTLKAFFNKLNGVSKRANLVGTDFNELTKEAVNIVWNPEIGDISAINRTIAVAVAVKGFDDKALIRFYKLCVPFTFNSETQQFTKKNPKHVDKLVNTWKAFLESNNWYDFEVIKPEKEYVYKPETVLKSLNSFLDKAQDHDALTLSGLMDLQKALNMAISERLRTSEQHMEHDDLADNEIDDQGNEMDETTLAIREILLQEAS